jgi:hypothetical protein
MYSQPKVVLSTNLIFFQQVKLIYYKPITWLVAHQPNISIAYFFKYSFAVSTGRTDFLKSFLLRVIIISNSFSSAV